MLPQARRQGLTVRELPDETLVYDLQRHQAHCLNRTTALVWRHCDGRTSTAALAALLHAELLLPADEDVVRLALVQLAKAHLLQQPVAVSATERLRSRRQLMRKLGVSLVLLPAVLSITAPKASAAASDPVVVPPPPPPPPPPPSSPEQPQ